MDTTAEHRLLGRGQLFGAATGVLRLDDVVLTETRYAINARLPAHAHELPMFVFVAAGSFDERFDRHQRTCGPGRLIFRPAGERHENRFLNRGGACLTIELTALDGGTGLARVDGRLRLDGSTALLAMRIYDEFRRPTAETALVVEECVAYLAGVADRRAVTAERTRPKWLEAACESIDAGLPRPVRLGELADEVQVHRVHLSRTFRRFFGCGVSDYVRRLRVHHACARIRSGGEPLSAIAGAVGFSDESHMGRAFREVMGRSPGGYRRARI